MRLSSLDQEDWIRWAPYVDTLLLPLYRVRITGKQPDLEEARRVREVAARVERELTGRLLLLPAIPYAAADPGSLLRYVESVAEEVKGDFHHFFLLAPETYRTWLKPGTDGEGEWLFLPGETDSEPEEQATKISDEIVTRWNENSEE
ncbi:hypothetical protein HMPREF9374_0483 [Desmospora sp. 8437]|nr:hypothetical protein HMPREF9374_0483 [Desmospora sp. 8437]